MKKFKLNWILNSRAYDKARALMNSTLNSPELLSKLVTDGQGKLTTYKDNARVSVIEPIETAIRLIKAYASGEYRDIPFESIALIITAIIYFIMPIDVVPDFILALGHLDDIAVLTWTFRTVADELKKFITWEINNEAALPSPEKIEDQSKIDKA